MGITTKGKIVIGLLVAGALYGGVRFGKSRGWIPEKKQISVTTSVDINSLDKFKEKYGMTRPLRVGICTWGGYAGGIYQNKKLAANVESEFYKKYGILLDIVLNDDLNTSFDSWKSGDVDIMWTTVDAFTTQAGNLPENPQIIYQIDWSRGGDVIVGKRGINSVNDLKGKKVSVALGTPSHSLLLKALEASNMKVSDIDIVSANSAPEAAQFFKAGKVDAAVVWSPDDQDCIASVTGAGIVLSTKNASNIIADAFFAKKAFINQHEELIRAFTEAWLVGNAKVNSDEGVKDSAAYYLSVAFNQPLDFCKSAINNVRLTTYGDNTNFFNLSGNYKGVKGEDIYVAMTELYRSVHYISGQVPAWKTVVYSNNLRNISLSDPTNTAENVSFNKATKTDSTSSAIASKVVSISYPTGSYDLTDDAKSVIDREMVPVTNQFGSSRIRISGNTDNVGNQTSNKTLSFKRANSVVKYLVEQYHVSKDRFIVVGNGDSKPVSSNETEDGKAKNRRTDFEVIR